tara:strand:+ start:695 stop:1201 length:507 start_codon:yes stop_codon:yes gene_type:complete
MENNVNLMRKLTHINNDGEAEMVDVSGKPQSRRTATAISTVTLKPDTLRAIKESTLKKGDVISVARIAGIQAAKKCSELIPLCHLLPISKVSISFSMNKDSIEITAFCKTIAQTGVEMEALTAASIAALTIYDMCKSIDKGIEISCTRLVKKTGGAKINSETVNDVRS